MQNCVQYTSFFNLLRQGIKEYTGCPNKLYVHLNDYVSSY